MTLMIEEDYCYINGEKLICKTSIAPKKGMNLKRDGKI